MFMLYLYLLVSFFDDVTPVNADKELIFNADRKIFDRISETIGRCFIACPAMTDDQQKFNRDESITKNSLFLIQSLVSPADHGAPLVKCENLYKPSIVFRKDSKRFEVGYEVYFNQEEMKGNRLVGFSKSSFLTIGQLKANNKLTNKLLKFLSTGFGFKRSKSQKNTGGGKKNPSDSLSTTSRTDSDSDFESLKKNNQGDANNVKQESKNQAEKDPNEILWLYWIKVFHFDFDVGQRSPIKVVYSADLGELNAAYECENYNADEVLYKKVDFESIYKQANQAKLFENLPAFPNISGGQCGQEFGCLKPHQLIPHYYYHSRASKITTCSAVNTLPVWVRISDGILTKIDRYLYAISQIWGPNVKITTGATGILSYPTGSLFSRVSARKLFLDLANKKVPVPDIIYKIVEFRKNTEEYHVIIVIHNDPLATEINHVCPPDKGNFNHKNLLNSWNFVANEVKGTGLSYPCFMEEEVLDRLKVSRRRSRDMFYLRLLLNEFPLAELTKQEQTIDEKNLDEVPEAKLVEKELSVDDKKKSD